MRPIFLAVAGLWTVAVMATACADESPTDVGADLLGPGVLTYDVTLAGADFLTTDTTFDRIGSLDEAGFRLVAHEFDGVLEAGTLFRVNRPLSVTWVDEDNVGRTDSISALVGGTLTMLIDTVVSTPGPIDVDVRQVTESWHRPTASWTLRADTADAPLPWTTPGGSSGALLGSGTWTGGDTLRIVLDSAGVAVWADEEDARTGGLLQVTTPDARLFIRSIEFRFDVRPGEADTVVAAGSAGESRIIVTPEEVPAAVAGELRVGGLPAWRSMLRFRPMREIQIPCGPDSPTGCMVSLGDVRINLATLLLEPMPAGAFRIERPVRVDPRAVLETALAPLSRSPLTTPVGPATEELALTLFDGTDPEPPPVRIDVTFFVARNLSPPAGQTRWDWLALTALGERGTFGHVLFGGLDADRPPRLRLVVSRPIGELIR